MPPMLVAITGPIGAGKSTVAAALGRRLGATVLDLDDVFFTDVRAGWETARRRHAEAVAGELAAGRDVVAHGPFNSDAERRPLASLAVATTWVLLLAPYEVALQRVLVDSGRNLSRDPEFLRATHDAFTQLRAAIPAELVYDTTVHPADRIVDDLVTRLRAAPGTGPAPRS